MVEQIDIEDIIAERMRRRAEVQEFTRSLPALTPVQLPVCAIPLPRGADEDVPGHIIPRRTARRTERNFRKRCARTHKCREPISPDDHYKRAHYLERLNFGYGTSPEKGSDFKVYGYANNDRVTVLRDVYSYPAGNS